MQISVSLLTPWATFVIEGPCGYGTVPVGGVQECGNGYMGSGNSERESEIGLR